MAVDYKMLARAKYDPLTQNGLYRSEKKSLRDSIAAESAAAVGGFGSVAQRNDPNQFGSIASRQAPGLFGPGDPHAMYSPIIEPDPPPEAQTTSLQRKIDKTPFNMDDLSDDEFLQSLGLSLGGGLRRGGV